MQEILSNYLKNTNTNTIYNITKEFELINFADLVKLNPASIVQLLIDDNISLA